MKSRRSTGSALQRQPERGQAGSKRPSAAASNLWRSAHRPNKIADGGRGSVGLSGAEKEARIRTKMCDCGSAAPAKSTARPTADLTVNGKPSVGLKVEI